MAPIRIGGDRAEQKIIDDVHRQGWRRELCTGRVRIVFWRRRAEDAVIAFENEIGLFPVAECRSLPFLFANGVDDLAYCLTDVEAKEDDLRMAKRVEHANRVGEGRPIRIVRYAHHM